MARRRSRLTAVALAALAAACDQPAPSAPQADEPRFKPQDSPFACVFNGNPSLSNSANAYFTLNSDRKTASDLISAMAAAYNATPKDVAALRTKGFELLSLTGLVSRQNTASSPATGALLTKQAFNCMFDIGPTTAGFEGWPDDPHYDFSAALTPVDGGAYYVRGGTVVAPAVGNLAALNTTANPAAGNISAIGTPSQEDTWGEVLGQQVLFFGNKVTDGYDWKVLPRNATFTPYAVVALCPAVNSGRVYDDADMVHQQDVGVLGFEVATSLCSTDPAPPFASLYRGGSLFAALGRAIHSTGRWLSPQPAYATAVVTAVIGGKVSGAKGDEFTFENLPTVKLDLKLADLGPRNTVQANTGRFSVTVDVTTPDNEPAGGITVTLSLVDNNGVGTAIFEAPEGTPCTAESAEPAQEITLATVGQNGDQQATKAIWTENLCITKTGSVTLIASSVADGNPNAGIASVASKAKINVKP